MKANCNACEWMVAIKDHMLGVKVGDGVEQITRRLWVAAWGQGVALKGVAFFQFGGKE